MIILHSHLQPQFKYELFHILHIIAQLCCAKNRRCESSHLTCNLNTANYAFLFAMALAQLLVDARRRQNPSFVSTIIEVIIDYGYAFVTYGKITETKSSQTQSYQFPSRGAADNINRGGLFAVARHSSKISALVPQEHQIRMRYDQRDNKNDL